MARGAGEAEGGASEVDLLAAQLLDAAAQAQGALLEAAWTEHGARGGREETWEEPWQESAPPAAVWRALPQAHEPPHEPPPQPPHEQEQEPQERMEAAEQAPPVHMLLPGAPFRNAGFRWRST